MKKFLLAALLAGVASSAMAADLPSKKHAPAVAPVYVAPVFTWTGFYGGLNAGYGWGGNPGGVFQGPVGGMFGGTAGYNYQLGQFVIGAEGDFDWAGMRNDNTFGRASSRMSVDSMLTARARAGVALDRALIYLTGGYAGAEVTGSVFDVGNGVFQSSSGWRNGGVIGAGLEYAFTNNISAKAEYLYAPLSSASYFGGTADASGSRLDISTIRTGLNYKF